MNEYNLEECIYRERWNVCKDIDGVYFLPTHEFSMSAPTPSVVVTQGGDFGVEYHKDDFFKWHIRTQGHTNKSVSELDNSVLKWFTTNCDNLRLKCEMLPLGVVDETCIELINSNLNNTKDKLIYCNFQLYSNKANRTKVLQDCHKLPFCTREENLEPKAYFESMSRHKFVVCPTGNGIDSYRIWEGLYQNTIPVVQESDFAIRLSRYFPVLITEDYAGLTEEFLDSFLEGVDWNYKDKLKPLYWIEMIKDSVRKYL